MQRCHLTTHSHMSLCCTQHREHFVNAPSQWETTLHCNVVSLTCRLGAYTKWSHSKIQMLYITFASEKSWVFIVTSVWRSDYIITKLDCAKRWCLHYESSKSAIAVYFLWYKPATALTDPNKSNSMRPCNQFHMIDHLTRVPVKRPPLALP